MTPISNFFLFGILTALPFYVSADRPKLATDIDKYSYQLGAEYMQSLKEDDMPLDFQRFLQGMRDVQAGRSLELNDNQARQARDYFIAKRSLSHQRKMEEALVQGREFMLNNKFQPGVTELSSGLQYKVLRQGNGVTPKSGDGISIRFRVLDTANHQLAASPEDGTPRKMLLDQLLPGWKQALSMMKEGDKWLLALPPDLVYGAKGSREGHVKPNQTLQTELELVGIIPAQEALQELDKPTVTKNTVPSR